MTTTDLPDLLKPHLEIQIMDVGASVINEVPVYKPMLDSAQN